LHGAGDVRRGRALRRKRLRKYYKDEHTEGSQMDQYNPSDHQYVTIDQASPNTLDQTFINNQTANQFPSSSNIQNSTDLAKGEKDGDASVQLLIAESQNHITGVRQRRQPLRGES